MDAVVLNCVTQFNIVWCVGTFPFLPMSKCHRKTRRVTVAESLFLKNVSTANARCSADQRCMMTEGFKPCHLQRCWHGAKFKLSNCFCPSFIMLLPLVLFWAFIVCVLWSLQKWWIEVSLYYGTLLSICVKLYGREGCCTVHLN